MTPKRIAELRFLYDLGADTCFPIEKALIECLDSLEAERAKTKRLREALLRILPWGNVLEQRIARAALAETEDK